MTTKTEFIAGDKDKFGNDTSSTEYKTLVQDAQSGTPPKETNSALFDEQALDPYEVQNAQ